MTGINLNQIESFTFGGQTVSSFIRQSETEIAFTCPSLEDGEYTLTGRTTSGKEVMFYTTAGNITEQTVVVSSERVLWEGHHYVSWDLPDDNPNKTFNLIGKDVFASIKAVSRIKHILFSKLCRRISPVAHHNRLVERSARYCRHRIPGRRSKTNSINSGSTGQDSDRRRFSLHWPRILCRQNKRTINHSQKTHII